MTIGALNTFCTIVPSHLSHLCSYCLLCASYRFSPFSSSNHLSQSSSKYDFSVEPLLMYHQGELITDRLESQNSLYNFYCLHIPHYVVIIWTYVFFHQTVNCLVKYSIVVINLLYIKYMF